MDAITSDRAAWLQECGVPSRTVWYIFPLYRVDRETSGIGRELASLLLRLIDGEVLEGQLLYPPILKVC